MAMLSLTFIMIVVARVAHVVVVVVVGGVIDDDGPFPVVFFLICAYIRYHFHIHHLPG